MTARLVIDLDDRTVTLDGLPIRFAHLQFNLLALLATSPGRVFTFKQIAHQVWDSEPQYVRSSIRVLVCRIRDQINAQLPQPIMSVEAVRSVGYRLDPTAIHVTIHQIVRSTHLRHRRRAAGIKQFVVCPCCDTTIIVSPARSKRSDQT